MAASAIASGLSRRQAADEAMFFRKEEEDWLKRRVESMRKQSQAYLAPSSSGSASRASRAYDPRVEACKQAMSEGDWSPSSAKVRRKPKAFQVSFDKTARLPIARSETVIDYFKVPQVSMGRSKWEAQPGASVFSVKDGKRLAQEPVVTKHTAAEMARLRRIEEASIERATALRGWRVLPKLTPGRAFVWGTALAVYGTAVAVVGGSKVAQIRTSEDLAAAVRGLAKEPVDAMRGALRSRFVRGDQPVKVHAMEGERSQAFVNKLKTKMT